MVETKSDDIGLDEETGEKPRTRPKGKPGPSPAVRRGVSIAVGPKAAPVESHERRGGRIPLK